ncbi:MAG: ribonuclease Z [Clostridia bacterium]|nr:ribonuclease Z [Clostridia bacterium]
MRIVFFGSSHGVPEPNRRCTSILIEVGENRYFIDMGTQSIEELATRRIPVDSVKAVFITHMHGDHTNGLISFVDLCTWYYKTANPEFYLPEPVDCAVDAINGWMKCNGKPMRDFKFSPVKEGPIFDDGIIRVTAYKTLHTACSWAFLVEAEGKRVLFGGDMCGKGPKEDFPLSVLDAPLDLAICEAAHFPATAYLPILGDADLKRLCITHYSDTFLASVLELKKALPHIPVFRAEDGLEINL